MFSKLRSQDSIVGTHNQGSLKIKYNDLVKAFGKPHHQDSNTFDKITTEWGLKFKDGTIATIYDWKEYDKSSPNQITNWEVGGHNKDAYTNVKKILNRQ